MEKIMLPQSILNITHNVVKQTTKKFYKNGIELEKGALITNDRIEKNKSLYEIVYNYWMCYPDMLVEVLTPSTSHFKLYFYQRLFLRAIIRHGRVCVIAPRALITRRSIKNSN